MSTLVPNNRYWIDTENYGVLKAQFKQAGHEKVAYFQCDLVDGFLILNNGVRYVMDRGDEEEKPQSTTGMTKEEAEALGWKR